MLYSLVSLRKWRNWQTRKPQELVGFGSWGFKSPLPHQTTVHGSATVGAEPPAVAEGGAHEAAFRRRRRGSRLRPADELHAGRFLSDGTWDALGGRYSDAQRREVVMIVGNYTRLAMFRKTLGVQLPEGFTGLPSNGRHYSTGGLP